MVWIISPPEKLYLNWRFYFTSCLIILGSMFLRSSIYSSPSENISQKNARLSFMGNMKDMNREWTQSSNSLVVTSFSFTSDIHRWIFGFQNWASSFFRAVACCVRISPVLFASRQSTYYTSIPLSLWIDRWYKNCVLYNEYIRAMYSIVFYFVTDYILFYKI